jgi:hypothetical protein
MYTIGAVLTFAWAIPYFLLLNSKAGLLVFAGVFLSLIPHDIQYGPQAALIAESFGPEIRYSGAGLGYQLASVIAGGPAPLIATAILDATGSSTYISWYIVGCAVIAMIALLLMPARNVREAPSALDAVPAATIISTQRRATAG